MAGLKQLSPEQWAFWGCWTSAQRVVARAIDQRLQRECGISKAEFSVLVTLLRSPDRKASMSVLVDALDWEKSRVSHQLTRMQKRGFVRASSGPGGRRTEVALTDTGQRTIEGAITVHGESVRRYFLETLSLEQAAAIRDWCDGVTRFRDAFEAEPSFEPTSV